MGQGKGNIGKSPRDKIGIATGVHQPVSSGGDQAAQKQSNLRTSDARMSTSKEGGNGKKSSVNDRDTGMPKARSTSFGSRFSSLNELEEVDDMDMEAMNVEDMQGASEGTNVEVNKTPTRKGGVKGSRSTYRETKDDYDAMDLEGTHEEDQQVNLEGLEAEMELGNIARSNENGDQGEKANIDEEEVIVAVSHARLAEGLNSRFGLDVAIANEGKTASQRLTKTRMMKDITNKLDPKPTKLKPNWSGPRGASGLASREVGSANQWTTYKVDPKLGCVGPLNKTKPSTKGGPMNSRPPDPSRGNHPEASRQGVDKTGSGCIGDRERQNGEKEDEERREMEETEKMETLGCVAGSASTNSDL